jgi:pyridoxal phosphate enzyme (YggS family)
LGSVADNIREVLGRVRAAALRAGRDPETVRLVAVTKTFPAGAVIEAFEAGVRIVGENRVQEALAKKSELAGWVSEHGGPAWHMIGTLQKNKARHAVGEFELIHSLDSEELAREIDKRARARGIVQKALVEVNVSGEQSKHGVRPEHTAGLVRLASGLKGVEVVGLMCIPPFTDNPEDSIPHYRALRTLFEELNRAGAGMTELSMGMTQDYEAAVEEGATLIRVGTAIFGHRSCGI